MHGRSLVRTQSKDTDFKYLKLYLIWSNQSNCMPFYIVEFEKYTGSKFEILKCAICYNIFNCIMQLKKPAKIYILHITTYLFVEHSKFTLVLSEITSEPSVFQHGLCLFLFNFLMTSMVASIYLQREPML